MHPNTPFPEFLRLPRGGTLCPITGLSRSALNSLILGPRPAVRSVSLRRAGALRGIRLIPTAELLNYLRQQLEEAQQERPDGSVSQCPKSVAGSIGDSRAFSKLGGRKNTQA